MCKILIVFAAFLALTQAQSTTTPVSCVAATSLDFNNTNYFGTWLEVARNPSKASLGCVSVFAESASNGTQINVSIVHSKSNTTTYMSEKETATITLVKDATTGYSIDYSDGNKIFTKLLTYTTTTDGLKWLVGCGYNPANTSDSFGFLLSNKKPSSADITAVNNNAAADYSDFVANNISTILQDGCYQSSAAKTIPMLSTIMGLIYILFKAL